LVFVTLLVLAASYTLFNRLKHHQPEIVRAADNSRVLGQARTALFGYALRADSHLPGQLPCPDTDNDGLSDNCAGAGPVATGYLPWLELGLADLRDASGERLWYVLAREFDGSQIINSDSVSGSLSIDGIPGYAAIVFAPGKPIMNQARPPAAQGNVARFLEADNADNDNLYVTQSAGEFNDQLLDITAASLIQATERRVTAMLRRELQDYYSQHNYYPNPAAQGGIDCDSSRNHGLIPLNISSGCSGFADWGGSAELPAWFSAQGWNNLVWYAVAPACHPATMGCSGSGFLTASGSTAPADNKQAIVLAAGPRRGGQNPRPGNLITDLLDSTENTDGDDVFEHTPVGAASNDQLLVVAP
jgi:hypothetical protein